MLNFRFTFVFLAGLFAGIYEGSTANAQPRAVVSNTSLTCAVLLAQHTWKLDVPCSDWNNTSAIHHNIESFQPPYRYRTLWYEVEACISGFDKERPSTSYNEINFFAVRPSPQVKSFLCSTEASFYCMGMYFFKQNALLIAVESLDQDTTIKHEFMHAQGISSHTRLPYILCSDEQWPLLNPLPL